MDSSPYVGLLALAMILYTVYRIKAPSSGRNNSPPQGGGILPMGRRRPFVEFGGELREVLHRRNCGDRVECTLRPQSPGASRLRIAVPKDSIIWKEELDG
jgi:hypothetical protein